MDSARACLNPGNDWKNRREFRFLRSILNFHPNNRRIPESGSQQTAPTANRAKLKVSFKFED
jgi:hypothetical protein